MKKIFIIILALGTTMAANAGNPDRAGSAGASHILVNPWARSSGLGNSSMASVNGPEAMFLNVAGLAFVRKTELTFTNNQYLVGSGIKINALGFGQKVGESGALGISVSSMSFGEIPITEVDLPEGGIGTFSPVFTNIGLSYAKGFSNSIYGGITARLISEAIYNVKAQGIAFDAGIRYVTGEKDNIRFGIALRNVGPPMRYRGDGLSIDGTISTGSGNTTSLTVDQRADKFELPSMVNVGFAYDFIFSEKSKLTGNLQFTSNSFTRDQFGIGAEYSFNNRFILRGGYAYETNIGNEEETMTVYVGPSAGLTVQIPAGKNGTLFGFDYSYRLTNPFGGVHSLGVHIDI
ncbi:MAG: PorV/PorQ family protein [Flavobacteriales bacterium]|nr:PorV/PorQ family protein [Flavobacteriales bacterium]